MSLFTAFLSPYRGWGVLTLLGVGAVASLGAQTVTVSAPGCTASMYEFRFNGVSFDTVAALTPGEGEGEYELENTAEDLRIAYVGPLEGGPAVPILLDGEESFRVSGSCRAMGGAEIEGSAVNTRYRELKAEMVADAKEAQRLGQQLGGTPVDAPGRDAIRAELQRNDSSRLAKLEALDEGGEAFFAAMLAANLYTSFANTDKGYGDELTYFMNERFQYADFSKAAFANNPWVFESFRDYTGTLLTVNLPGEALTETLNGQLDLVYNNRPVHKLALGGVLATLRAAQNPLAAEFAKQYLKRYAEEEPGAVAALETDIERFAAMAEGGEAPAFAQASLDGEGELGPQDFRGKVLLIDFWASWCGPCRRENPNVVRMYNEFKDSGFEILGVSLDKTRGAWEKAVKKDGLMWPHVSDLRGWSNAAAQLYGVRSIPATVLLDAEGRIVARNLRGEALRSKVAELVSKGG